MVRNKHNTPVIIKYPFRRMTAEDPRAFYASVSLDAETAPRGLEGRSILINGDIGGVLAELKNA